MLANFLIFLAPFSLFSVNIMGFELYASYLFFPLGVTVFLSQLNCGRTIFLNKTSLCLIIFVLFILLAMLTRSYLLSDLMKIVIMCGTFSGIAYRSRKDFATFSKIVDMSISILVLYGLFQYVMVVCDNAGTATWLHNLVGFEGHGGPVDTRGGILRVASLTKEPSYFAFIVGVYFFITKNKFVRLACCVGLLISFSMITVYAVLGLSFLRLFRQFRINTVFILTAVVVTHVSFVHFFEMIPPFFGAILEERYSAIVYLVMHGGFSDWILGTTHIQKDFPINLVHPYSNVGSILLLYGWAGMFLYLYFFCSIARMYRYPYAVYALFFFNFNYYYLTAWPIVLIFFVFFLTPQEHVHANL